MAAETPLTPAASALYSLSRIAASSSCVITHPITAAWALVREWGTCPWLSELDGRPHRAVLLDGICNTAVGARRVLHIGEQRMFEKLTAVDDEDHILKWRLISHTDTINPFLASLVNHESRIKLTPIALGNHTLIEWQGTFLTEPQHALSMKATFAKLYMQGFRSLQTILTANALTRSQSGSEGSEARMPNGRSADGRGSSLGSSASGSLGSSRAGSHKSSSLKSSSFGSQASQNGDRDVLTIALPSKYAQAYPKSGQPLSSMRNPRGASSLETIPSDRQLPMEDLAIRSNSEPDTSTSSAEEQPVKAQDRAVEKSPRPERSPREASEEEAPVPGTPTSHGLSRSGGSFTFNEQLLVPTSSLGPQLNGFAQCLSLPSTSAGVVVSGGPTSPVYQGNADGKYDLMAARRNEQRFPGPELPHAIAHTNSDGMRFTDDACELARMDARDLQRISDAFQRSRILGVNGFSPEPHPQHNGEFQPSASKGPSKDTGVRDPGDLLPLSRAPVTTGEPALGRGANMLMPQMYDSRVSSSCEADSNRSLTRPSSGRVSLDAWVSRRWRACKERATAMQMVQQLPKTAAAPSCSMFDRGSMSHCWASSAGYVKQVLPMRESPAASRPVPRESKVMMRQFQRLSMGHLARQGINPPSVFDARHTAGSGRKCTSHAAKLYMAEGSAV